MHDHDENKLLYWFAFLLWHSFICVLFVWGLLCTAQIMLMLRKSRIEFGFISLNNVFNHSSYYYSCSKLNNRLYSFMPCLSLSSNWHLTPPLALQNTLKDLLWPSSIAKPSWFAQPCVALTITLQGLARGFFRPPPTRIQQFWSDWQFNKNPTIWICICAKINSLPFLCNRISI